MKYVMLRHRQGLITRDMPVMFPNLLVHEEVAKAVARMMMDVHDWPTYPVSAGDFNPLRGTCDGRSETLGLSSRPEDARIIMTNDYGGGIT